jgi:hypothetical protein
MSSWSAVVLGLVTALAAATACSSSSTGTGTGSGSSSGSQGSSSSAGSSGIACNISSMFQCIEYPGVMSGADSTIESNCTSSLMGTVEMSGCSTTGLFGCCGATAGGYATVTCYYSGGPIPTAADVMEMCGSSFQATP